MNTPMTIPGPRAAANPIKVWRPGWLASTQQRTDGGGTVADQAAETSTSAAQLRAHVADAIAPALVAIEPDGTVAYLNRSAEDLYGCTSGWAVGRTAFDVLRWNLPEEEVAELIRCHPATTGWSGDVLVRGAEQRPVSVTVSPVRVDGAVVAMVASAHETSERDAARAALHHHLTHDEATGLPNRNGIVRQLDALAASRGPDATMVVVHLGLDGIRPISDAFGDATACEVTRSVARVLAGAAHSGDVVARTSDTTFVVCCPHITDDADARALADRLRHLASEPVAVGAARLALRAAAGVVIDREGTQADEVLHRADIALSQEREAGRHGTSIYDDALREQIVRQVDIEALIRRAIALGEVPLAYQPVVRLSDQEIIGSEALLRMVDAAGGAVPAPEAIAIAERTGLIDDLGLVILRTACREAARWQHRHPERPVSVAVNVSASQLDDAAFPDQVEAALRASGLQPARLTLEMTETVLMSDSDRSTRQLARLKMSGVRLAADDFGTGYSSLAYLKRFPLDAIKADLSFVAGLPDSPEDVAVVSAIVAMADAVGLHVVAEGVENLRQLAELERLGCGFGQGYLWSRAVPGDELLELLEQRVAQREPEPGTDGACSAATSHREDHLQVAFRSFAHEARNPLSIVTGWAAILGDDTSTAAEAIEAGRHIGRAAARIDRLLGSLDDVVALDEGRLELDATAIDLRALVADLLADRGHEPSGRVVFTGADGPPARVRADTNRIEQVVTNLVSNALKFSPADAPVEVAVSVGDAQVVVCVADHGPGIAEADLALAFRRFGRLDRSTPGSGMGLYLARGIARTHGGDVTCRARSSGGGAIFELRLPRLSPG